jgi:hypothetical protein
MFFRKKEYPDNDSINLIKRMGGKHFATVSEIDDDGTERLLGRGGGVNIVGRDVVIISNGSETFRVTVESLRASELMSGNGLRLTGVDRQGNHRRVIAVFSKLGG